jgi:hypothetical protein
MKGIFMKSHILKFMLAGGLGLVLTGTAIGAQQYSIDWFKVAAGGGTSSQGQFAVSGTTGQSDAGAMSGGSYSVYGGFWSLLAVPGPGMPALSILPTRTNTVVIAWPAPSTGFVLQQSSALATGNWSTVTNTPIVTADQNQVIINPPSGSWFYRLKK